MPIATASKTRLGPWGVSMEPYGAFTGRSPASSNPGAIVYWRGTSETGVTFVGTSQTTSTWRGSSETGVTFTGRE